MINKLLFAVLVVLFAAISQPVMSQVEIKPKTTLQIITEATVRIKAGTSCGTGTVCGTCPDTGNALVLTNAHVVGDRINKRVQLQRWNADGSSEQGQGVIVQAAYNPGVTDFAVVRCQGNFADGITALKLSTDVALPGQVVTSGCPSCEWPSIQSLSVRERTNQIIRWNPQAITGRSGSAVVSTGSDGNDPMIIGLLTWGGGGSGYAQSSSYIAEVMQGRIPTSARLVPIGVTEVAAVQVEARDYSTEIIGSPRNVIQARTKPRPKQTVRRSLPLISDAFFLAGIMASYIAAFLGGIFVGRSVVLKQP